MILKTLAAILLTFAADSANCASMLSTRVGITTATVTATSSDYTTSTITNFATVTSMSTVCAIQSAIPLGVTCADSSAYSLGSLYYQNYCSSSLTGGTVIRVYAQPAVVATSICISICNALNNLQIAASSCNGIVFASIGALNECFIQNGDVSLVPASTNVFAVAAYTTNPCVITGTTITTETTETIETDIATYVSTFESTFSETVTIIIPDSSTSSFVNVSTISSQPTTTASSSSSVSVSSTPMSSTFLSSNSSSAFFDSISSSLSRTSTSSTNTSSIVSSTVSVTVPSSGTTSIGSGMSIGTTPTMSILTNTSTTSRMSTIGPNTSLSSSSSSSYALISSPSSPAPISVTDSVQLSSTLRSGAPMSFKNSSTTSPTTPGPSSTSSLLSASNVSSSSTSPALAGSSVPSLSTSPTSSPAPYSSTALSSQLDTSARATILTSASGFSIPPVSTPSVSLPSATVIVGGTIFSVNYNITYDGILLELDGLLVKRAASTLDTCLSDCAADMQCKATSYDDNGGVCTYFRCVYQNTVHTADRTTFAAVLLREASDTAVDVDPFLCDNSKIPSLTPTAATSGTTSNAVAPTTVLITQEHSDLIRFITTTYTTVGCPSSVSDCHASDKSIYLTTRTITEDLPLSAIQIAEPEAPLDDLEPFVPGYSTSTLYSTSIQTIYACPSTVENCPASEKTMSHTEVVLPYTTTYSIYALPATVPDTGAPITDHLAKPSSKSVSGGFSYFGLGPPGSSPAPVSASSMSFDINPVSNNGIGPTPTGPSETHDEPMSNFATGANGLGSASVIESDGNATPLNSLNSEASKHSDLIMSSEARTSNTSPSSKAFTQTSASVKLLPYHTPVATSTILHSITQVVGPTSASTLVVFTGSSAVSPSSIVGILSGIICATVVTLVL
ncbi:hypothetical protein QM012_007027 [Aureobasidium pullulans]|uniref:Apple domain-containing protein n=1 Tax=Aureobasidium pullulans TaxID=5580 RepID=A0ABR0TQ92_AURPU